MMIKTDCRNFPLDRPCALHKQSGRLCAGCSAYVPVKTRGNAPAILIIKLGAMGDVLRTTFLLPGLKELYPQCRISWLVAAGSEDILRGNPLIDTIISAGPDAFSVLARQYFDVAINLDLAPESLAWARLAFARKKIGFLLDGAGRITASNATARRWIGLSANDVLKKVNTHTYQYWMARMVGLPRPAASGSGARCKSICGTAWFAG
jgi:heptosyltransferase-2